MVAVRKHLSPLPGLDCFPNKTHGYTVGYSRFATPWLGFQCFNP
jgi:hypothetical protein